MVIPEGVSGIGPGAFLGCSSLESVVIPDTLHVEADSFPSAVSPTVYSAAGTATVCSADLFICSPGFTGSACDVPAVTSENEAAQSLIFYIAVGAIAAIEVVYFWRTAAKLAFACLVLFRTFDFASDWANYAIALQSANFIEGAATVGLDPTAISSAALAFNIIGTLLWIPDMRALFETGESGLTKYIVFFEDIPQLAFAGIYIYAVLSTSVYDDASSCDREVTGTLPLDPVVVVSLVFSSIGLLCNIYLAFCGGEEKIVLSGRAAHIANPTFGADDGKVKVLASLPPDNGTKSPTEATAKVFEGFAGGHGPTV